MSLFIDPYARKRTEWLRKVAVHRTDVDGLAALALGCELHTQLPIGGVNRPCLQGVCTIVVEHRLRHGQHVGVAIAQTQPRGVLQTIHGLCD